MISTAPILSKLSVDL